MITRQRVPELMDDPSLDYESHAQALRGLGRLNAASNGPGSIWAEIEREARLAAGASRSPKSAKTLRILDIATGGGDTPIALYHKAKQAGLKVEIVGSDISLNAIAYAKANALQKKAEIEFVSMDVFQDQLPTDFDIIVTSLFTHHLDPGDVVMLLAKMSQAARLKVIVNDLVRSEISYLSVWLATRLLSRSTVVHYDGPVSVNASYTGSEFQDMARQAGMAAGGDVVVKSFFPCRQLLVWRRGVGSAEHGADQAGAKKNGADKHGAQ